MTPIRMNRINVTMTGCLLSAVLLLPLVLMLLGYDLREAMHTGTQTASGVIGAWLGLAFNRWAGLL